MTNLLKLSSLFKALVFGIIGFFIGVGIAVFSREMMDLDPWVAEPVVLVGYVFGLFGWLLGVGVWGSWAKEWLGLDHKIVHYEGWSRYFRFSTDHKVIGVQYLVTMLVLMLLGGLLAVMIRIELMDPDQVFLSVTNYNTAMSLHGIIMVAVAVAVIMGGFANFLLPLMIGADDVAFPRLNALSFWIVPPVGVMLLATPLMGGFDTGWTSYPPLSVVNASGQLLFLLAFLTFGLSSILGGLNFIATVITMRAPGMTWSRLPIFVWSVFAAAIISLTATQFVAFGMVMVILDRVGGTNFFNSQEGGDPLLFEHIFWFYSHPAVYIMILPAFGVTLEIITHLCRKPLFAYKWVVGSFFLVVILSFLVWAHHLFTSGMADYLHLPFMVITELISIPTGMVFLAGLGTIWMGRMWLTTPMLFCLGFLANFVIAGVTGIFLADIPTDIELQDTYFVVAHFHYTIMGAEIFAVLGAVYYWFPKITGRMFNDTLGKIHFYWLFIAYNVTFIPMFYAGNHGMNRRNPAYMPDLTDINIFISIAAFVLAGSFALFAIHLVYAWVRGPKAESNPWQARTLEWQTTSPPPEHNFEEPPEVVGDPYGYGEPGSAHLAPRAGGSSSQPQAGD